MPLIDERGRLFGRWNLIDALVGGLVLLLIPLGYGAFLLFRVSTPSIVSIEPAQVVEHQAGTVRVVGENLRPFLRARFGTFDARSFLVESQTVAEIRFSDLPVGTYDLVLLDEARELVRKPGALTVVALPPAPVVLTPLPIRPPPAPEMEMQAIGEFAYLSREEVRLIRVGATFERSKKPTSPGAEEEPAVPVADVLAVRAPEPGTQRIRVNPNQTAVVTTPVPGKLQVPSIVRLRCVVTGDLCKVGDAIVVQEAMIPLAVPVPPAEKFTRPVSYVIFRITELRPVDTPVAFPTIPPPVRPPPLPQMEMQAVGTFAYLSPEEARLVRVGSTFERPKTPGARDQASDEEKELNASAAEVLAVRAPETGTQRVRVSPIMVVSTPVPDKLQVPAIIRLRCAVTGDQCKVGDAVVVQEAMIPLVVPVPPAEKFTRSPTYVMFRIEGLQPVDAPLAFPPLLRTAEATLRVHFLVRPEIVDLIKVGDVALPDPATGIDLGRGVLAALDPAREQTTGLTSIPAFQFQQAMTGFDATVRVPVVFTASGWQYKGKPVKLGAPFTFEAVSYVIDGWILSVQLESENPAATP